MARKQVEPIITRIEGPVMADINGRQELCDEIIYYDYGKQGTTVVYMQTAAEPIDVAGLNALLAPRGYRLAGTGGTGK